MEICSDTKEFISAFNQFEKEGLFELHIHQPAFYCLNGDICLVSLITQTRDLHHQTH